METDTCTSMHVEVHYHNNYDDGLKATSLLTFSQAEDNVKDNIISSRIMFSWKAPFSGPAQTADTVLAVALFEIRPYLAFANFVACYGLGLQRINTSLLWASPVPGTSTNQHLTVSVAVATYH